jgi:hypothetical protein
MGELSIARVLPRQENMKTHKKRKHRQTYVHAWTGIQTHVPTVQMAENSTWLRPRGPCDWQLNICRLQNINNMKGSILISGGVILRRRELITVCQIRQVLALPCKFI